jgi:hypothetical protein
MLAIGRWRQEDPILRDPETVDLRLYLKNKLKTKALGSWLKL